MNDKPHPGVRKTLSPKEARIKASRFCAYQERSQQQVRDKLYDYGLKGNEVEEVLSDLIVHGFINEERFARSYVRGKFRIKKWGRKKILQGLKQHQISDYCIRKGWEEINEEEYNKTLHILLEKKAGTLKAINPALQRSKIASYLIGRGFESDLVWTAVNGI